MPKPLAHERVLVTGASGFLGRHLVSALVGRGYHVYATTRSLSRAFNDFGGAVRWFEVDRYDPSALIYMLDEVGPELVFHLAGSRVAEDVEGAAAMNWYDNAGFTNSVLECLKQPELRRFITVGSAEEYGNVEGPAVEDNSALIQTSYGMAKAGITEMVLDRHRSRGFPGVVLRLFSVYGPHQPRGMFVAQAISHAVADTPFAMTEGRQKRDLVFVEDVIRALLAAAAEPGIDGKVINVASGKPTPLRNVAETIWRLSGTTAELRIGARPAPPEELHDTWADISRARELLDWQPQVALEDGLRQTIEWARTRHSTDHVA